MVRRLWYAVALLLVGVSLSIGCEQAWAETALIVVDDDSPALAADDDGGWSGQLGITNLTDHALRLSVTDGADCKPQLARKAIGAAQSRDIKLTVPKCKVRGNELRLILRAEGAKPPYVQLTAELKPKAAEPDWNALLAFVVSAIVTLIVLVVWTLLTHGMRKLEYLPATYSFKESWVSNITFLGGLLTGLFGSAEVVKALLGADSESTVALATVGSAIALILIGCGPILLTAAKQDIKKDGETHSVLTGYGLVLATTAVVAGASGQLWIGFKVGEALDLGGAEHLVVVGWMLAMLLLGWYTLATFNATLKVGKTPPPSPKPSELAQLIALLKPALEDKLGEQAFAAVVEEVTKAPALAGPAPVLIDALTGNTAVDNDTIPDIMAALAGSATTVLSRPSAGPEPLARQRRTAAMP